MSPAARRLRRGLLLAGGLLAGLAAAEGAARLFFPDRANGLRLRKYVESERGKFCRYDATLGWAGRADVDDTFEWGDCRARVRQNRHGFRGPAYPFERSDKRRIVVLGDSFVWGFGVDEDELFTRRMETAGPAPREVVNLGVSGYGTDQEYLLWTSTGRAWKPDEVYLCVTFHTDVFDNIMPVRYQYPKPVFRSGPDGELRLTNVPVPPRDAAWSDPRREATGWARPPLAGLLDRSDLACLLVTWASRYPSFARRLAATGLLPEIRAGYDWETVLYRVPADEDLRKYYGVLYKIAARLDADVRASGARLTLVIVPSVVQVYPDLWDRFRARADPAVALDPELPNRALAEIGRGLGVRVVDLLPPLREAAKTDPRLYFPVNLHWTAGGHRAVAEALLVAGADDRK